MESVTKRPVVTGSSQASGQFFIPDLCAPRPVFFLVLLSELFVLMYTLAASDLPAFNWNMLATASLLVQWLVLSSAALLCSMRGFFARRSLVLAAAGSITLVLLVTAVSSQLVLWFYPQLMAPAGGYWWLLRNLLMAALVAGIALRYFYLQQQLTLREHSELQARLDALRARIRPHFLFNTLNSIASLIASHPERAEEAVEDLAELFRASLRESERETTVADELRLCELYLGIEQLRLEGRLQLQWQVEEGIGNLPMPSLVLQPLVENAVYHGISRLQGGGVIAIGLARCGQQLQVTVRNPVHATSSDSQGAGIALANISQRLQALFGDDASLELSTVGGHFQARLSYPVEVAG